jgi:DNA-binding MurR/RpiR family transcriptional regulator
MSDDNLIVRMREQMHTLRPSEAKVGEAILADLDFAIHATIFDIAARAGVSQPSVTRFCRAIGCDSLKQFKVLLAQNMVIGVPYQGTTVSQADDTHTLIDKVCDSITGAMADVRTRIDASALAAAATALLQCRRVCCIGVGSGSGLAAQDAFLRFARLDLAASHFSDGHLQRLAAGMLDAGDILFAISLGGKSAEVLDSARIARERGALVIALTKNATPLAALADLPLYLPPSAQDTPFSPGVSRLIQLAVVDMLAIAIALRQPAAVRDKALQAKARLAATQSGAAGEAAPADGRTEP